MYENGFIGVSSNWIKVCRYSIPNDLFNCTINIVILNRNLNIGSTVFFEII